MRDIAVTLAVFGSLPFIMKRPWIGVLVWTWLGFMNPHRMAWGFSTSMPFAYIVALTTLIALLASKEPKRIPWTRESTTLLVFVLWMFLTTFFAVYDNLAWEQLEKVLKIQLMIFVGMVLINTRERLHWLVTVIALSIAFYGVKGGIFTILHGGVHRVQGPPGTFIDGNNEIGLALAMTIPLLFYLSRQSKRILIRNFYLVCMFLTAVGAIGTQSRGALVGLAGMSTMFWWKSKQKFLTLLLIGVSAYAIGQIMPEEWFARMNTIKTYEQDASALGRINAWHMAFSLASHRITGGGFECFQWAMFQLYAPDPNDVHDVHSVYFEVLGEHGFIGLALFLLLGWFTWSRASAVRRRAEKMENMQWLAELCRMVQASMVGYGVTGIFLGMAYFDYYYNLVLIVVVASVLVEKQGIADIEQQSHDPSGTLTPGRFGKSLQRAG